MNRRLPAVLLSGVALAGLLAGCGEAVSAPVPTASAPVATASATPSAPAATPVAAAPVAAVETTPAAVKTPTKTPYEEALSACVNALPITNLLANHLIPMPGDPWTVPAIDHMGAAAKQATKLITSAPPTPEWAARTLRVSNAMSNVNSDLAAGGDAFEVDDTTTLWVAIDTFVKQCNSALGFN